MEADMTRLHEKVQGLTKQAIGQMIGDDKLVVEGKEEQRHAEKDEADSARRPTGRRDERE
jgi:uncharacterized protein YjbJ (UPF0337 family)